jgi:hypothetical protein
MGQPENRLEITGRPELIANASDIKSPPVSLIKKRLTQGKGIYVALNTGGGTRYS